MTTKRPSPFRPLARSTLPAPKPRPTAPEIARPSIEAVSRSPGNVRVTLVITADVTIPQTPGYGRRLTNLLHAFRVQIEDEAPWLANLDIQVRTGDDE